MNDGLRRHRRRTVPMTALGLVGMVWVLVVGVPGTQGAPQQGTLPWQPAPGTEDQYAGAETCLMCHDYMAEPWAANPHVGQTAALGHASGDITCEACHGPAMPHVDAGGDPELVARRFNAMDAPAVVQACLSCHAGSARHAAALGSAHTAADVACTDCHSIHQEEPHGGLLSEPAPQLCFACHMDVQATFGGGEGHRVGEGLVSCTSCHNPHGGSGPAMLNRPMVGGGDLCIACHLDKRGPFVYEHPAGTAEGCVACHTPHGSPNRFMLKANDQAALCISCHPGALTTHNLADPRRRDCTTCHAAIHGSDTHRLFFRR